VTAVGILPAGKGGVLTIDEFMAAIEKSGGLVPRLGISVEVVGDEPVCRMTIGPAHIAAPDAAHGGAVMTLLDSALGLTALAYAIPHGQSTSTVEMKVNFLRPARRGRTLVTSTVIQSAGGSLLVATGKATDAETGEAVAFAVGTFNLYKADVGNRFG